MKKRKPTITEIELDRMQRRELMASRRPRQSARECFNRPPYTTKKESNNV